MRLFCLLACLVSVSVSAQPVVAPTLAQPVADTTGTTGTGGEPCPLEADQVTFAMFCADSGEQLTPHKLWNLYWGPDLSPLVASSPVAAEAARSYERSRAPRLAAIFASVGFLLARDVVSDDARPFMLGAAATTFGVGYVFSLRGDRAHRRAVSAYNESLEPRPR